MANLQGIVGPQGGAQGLAASTTQVASVDKQGALLASELHGRFYNQAYAGNMYFTGTTGIVALSANTITLTATTTPILGIYNPLGSNVNAVVLQAALECIINTVTTPVGAGAFVWAASTGNTAISTGLTPWNAKTLAQAGSATKGFAGATALTGLTNNLVIMAAADLTSPTALTYGTVANTALFPNFGGIVNVDGSLIVPPGGVLALLNTTSTTTMSYAGRLMWEEVPV